MQNQEAQEAVVSTILFSIKLNYISTSTGGARAGDFFDFDFAAFPPRLPPRRVVFDDQGASESGISSLLRFAETEWGESET